MFFIPGIYIILEWTAFAITSSSSFLHSSCAGYSGILFMYAITDALHEPAHNRVLCGMEVPSYLYPILVLLLLQILIPGVSFVGHLSGVLTGLLVVFGALSCCFPSRSFIIEAAERSDGYLNHLSQLSSYVPVNNIEHESFFRISSVHSSLARHQSRQCCDCSELWVYTVESCRKMINSISWTQSMHEYNEVSSTDIPSTAGTSGNGDEESLDHSIRGGETSSISTAREAAKQKEVRAIRVAKFSTT